MLQVPPAGTTTVPNTVVPFGAYKVIVSPGVPVPVIAGLRLLVIESVLLLPVSLVRSCVSTAERPETQESLSVLLERAREQGSESLLVGADIFVVARAARFLVLSIGSQDVFAAVGLIEEILAPGFIGPAQIAHDLAIDVQ